MGIDYETIMEISKSIIFEMGDGVRQEWEAASTNVRLDYDQDKDVLDDPEYVAAMKSDSPCVAVRKRTDIYTREEIYALMRQTIAEQYDIIREVIRGVTTPGSDPLSLPHGTCRVR